MTGPIYLDHHATTPCDERVVRAMLPFFTEHFGNAGSSSHSLGLYARAAVDRARERIGALIGAPPDDIVLTSGATEANNLAILGTATAAGHGHLIASSIEHSAVLDPLAHAERYGFEITRLPVDDDGLIDPRDVARALRPDTLLVSVMLANNEIGTVQPVAQIGELLREHRARLHVDAAQAPGWLPLDVAELGADLLSLSAHKMYGPKGIGALYARHATPGVDLVPLTFGGGQERGLRPGTHPVPLVVGFGRAAELAVAALDDGLPERVAALRDVLRDRLGARGAIVNGSLIHRLPNNLSVRFPGVRAQDLIRAVRSRIAVSTGSACSSETGRPSHVLTALGLDPTEALQTVRFGLGRDTTRAQIDAAADVIVRAVAKAR